MSFYSYKNANADSCPGDVKGNILNGLNKRVCIQVKNVYDSCLSQQQLDDEVVSISNIVPVLPGSSCKSTSSKACNCSCTDNKCTCSCPSCGTEHFPRRGGGKRGKTAAARCLSPTAHGRLRAAARPPRRVRSPTSASSACATVRSMPA